MFDHTVSFCLTSLALVTSIWKQLTTLKTCVAMIPYTEYHHATGN